MKNKLFILILIGLFFSINNSYSKEDHLDELKKISKNIRCLICQGQSIDDSNSDFAINIKYVILKKLNEGSSEDEIYDFLKSKYGDWIVYKPEFKLYNLLLWLIPYFIFFIGGILIYQKIFKKNEKTY
jgi:cytochrome c-type biogenesis protein CcmH|tara:strand:+ start:3947 stop:4330 length:384 start_codon:yes stop_codon:yes gene_type:complete